MSEDTIVVRRQPNNHMTAVYLLSSFEDPHWDTVSGGVKTTMFNQPFIYGYVLCTEAIEGAVAHSGEHGIENHGPCPHRIKVCALKKDNKNLYSKLLEIVGPRPEQSTVIWNTWVTKSSLRRSGSLWTYRELILGFLKGKAKSEQDIISYLFKKYHKYNIGAIRGELTKLVNQGLIACEGDSKDRINNIYKLIEK